MSETIVLVDLSSISRPIFEASGREPDPDYVSNAIVARVRELSAPHRFTAICCDSGRSFRHDISADYKANRPETPGAYLHQVRQAQEMLKADGFPVWSTNGFEADDLIASAVGALNYSGTKDIFRDVLIVSADKDLLQLVNERVSQYSPASGKTRGPAEVKAEFGVEPHQMLDYLALVGDKSDNITGAEGIGKVKASKLLTSYGNLDDLMGATDTMSDTFGSAILRALKDFKARMPTVKSLLTLRTDVPLPFDEIFKERIPTDVAEFSGENMNNDYPQQGPLTPEQIQAAYQSQLASGQNDANRRLEAARARAVGDDIDESMPTVTPIVADPLVQKAQRMVNAQNSQDMEYIALKQQIEASLQSEPAAHDYHAGPLPQSTTGHANIAAALAAAQGEIRNATKDSSNPFFNSKYADLASVWDVCRGPLSKNGLAVVQLPETIFIGEPKFEVKQSPRGERVTVKVITRVRLITRLLHTSGEEIVSVIDTLLPTGDPQSIGSAVTYLRRYTLAPMVGIASEDDDGEAATRVAPTVDQRQAQKMVNQR